MGISGARQKRLATQYGIASGGTESDITVSGVSYKLHTFTSDGNFVVSTGGWFDVLLVGGGNAGYSWAGGAGYAGGGGGAGGVLQQTVYLPPATHSVDIGAGASGAFLSGNIRGTQGFPSVIGTGINAIAASGGITYFPDNGATGTVGGELGSSGGCHNSATSSATNNVQGNKGGASTGINNGGGGGGFGAVGSAGSSTTGGAGGAGYDVSTFIGAGSSLFKAAGGGGGGSGAGGAGGSSIGGAGVTSGTGTAAGANTGSGGGGTTNTGAGGAGGSGIVYIRRRIEGDALATTQGYGVASGGTLSSITVGGVSYNLLTFTSDGTLTVTTPGLFDVLAVGGGGAGGSGGGGAGGIQQNTIYLSSNASVQIGTGIAYNAQGPASTGTTEINSGATNLVFGMYGGTGGAGYGFTTSYFTAGACGGGATGQGPTSNGLQGFAGGNFSGSTYGGGGGMGAIGGNANGTVGGNGGAGLDISTFLGQSAGTTFKAGGGGGQPSGAGGAGGGGASGSNGTANSGGGGGALSAGGSGILYVRFRTA